MRILYYDCYIGISGDMNLGALIDVGVDPDYLVKEISKLHLDSEFRIDIRKTEKKGISGTKADVVLLHHENHHDHHHDAHSHDHRNIQDIEAILRASELPDRIIASSLAMFMRIARAEAKVHSTTVDKIHFHEVGAIDSIVDIVGAAIAIDYLHVDKIISSPVQVGGGFVKCEHGLLPVPAPATVELLRGIPIASGLAPFETTTPTGAAILAENADEFTDRLRFTIEKTGYGFGTKDFDIPNALRVYLGTADGESQIEEQYLIETNIDDMSPEIISYVEERLFESGALDVFTTPITMKKGRPAVMLSVLVSRENEAGILMIIFRETTSIGVRKTSVEKIMLPRQNEKILTEFGEVSIKTAFLSGEKIKYKAEFDECKKIALENNVPIAHVYQAVDQAVWGKESNGDA